MGIISLGLRMMVVRISLRIELLKTLVNQELMLPVNGDLDYDIIAASQSGDKISWFENDGQANFIEHVICPYIGKVPVLSMPEIRKGV